MPKLCKVKGCPNKRQQRNPFCSTHLYRQRHKLPMDNRPVVKPRRRKEGLNSLARLLRQLLEV